MKSGLFDSNKTEISEGDIIQHCQGYYLIKKYPEFKTWFMVRQYGKTIDECSIEGNLEYCINELKWDIKIVGKIGPDGDERISKYYIFK